MVIMKIYEAIAEAKKILEENNIVDADLKAKEIMQYYLEMEPKDIIKNYRNEYDFTKFFEMIEKVSKNTPFQYVIGKAWFYGKEYIVDENVLIPRIDSEILAHEIISKVQEMEDSGRKEISILEIGTGSGAIAITAVENTNANILAVDISEGAINIAKENMKIHDIQENRMDVILSDIYENVTGKFDIIFSNPPYIRSGDLKDLDQDVLKEPHLALDGGESGLDYYIKIIGDAKDYLKEDGYIIFEIGYDQRKDIEKIAKDVGYTSVECIKDMENRDRVIIIRK